VAWCVLCFAPTIDLKVHQSFVRVPVENSLLKSWLRKSYNLQLFLNLPFQNTTTKATTMPNTPGTSLVCIMHTQNWLPSVNFWNLRVYHPIQCLPLDA